MSHEKQARPCGEISQERLLAAASEPGQVPEPVAEHLSRCPFCSAYVRGISEDLDSLTRMASRFTPAFSRPLRVPEVRPRELRMAPRPAFALALAAALVLFFAAAWLFSPGPGKAPGLGVPSPRAVLAEPALEENLFAEHALPPVYLEIAGEDVPGFEEDFASYEENDIESELWPDMDPLPGLTRAVPRKGALPC